MAKRKNRSEKTDFFVSLARFSFLEQFELLWTFWGWFFLFPVKNLYFAELFVGDTKNADGSFRWHHALDSSYVNFCVFDGSAVAHVDGKLKTAKSIPKQILAKLRVPLPFNLRLCRQVKETQNPHNPVLTKPFHPAPLDRAVSLWFPCNIWQEMLL